MGISGIDMIDVLLANGHADKEIKKAVQGRGIADLNIVDGDLIVTYTDGDTDSAGKIPTVPVTPEDFGAKGDGITDDTLAFTNALNSGHNVTCKKDAIYYFGGIVDASNIVTGILDLNNASLINFHIKLGIKDVYKPFVDYPGTRYIIKNGYIGSEDYYHKMDDWDIPIIQTGASIELENLQIRNAPYLIATVNAYRDNLIIRMVNRSWNASLWTEETLDLDGISLIKKDGSFVRFNDQDINDIIDPLNPSQSIAGDGWIFEQIQEWRGKENSDYAFARFYRNQPVIVRNCIQTKFVIAKLVGAKFLGCHFEDPYTMPDIYNLTNPSTKNYNTENSINPIEFDTCYFWNNYVLETENSNVSYVNCYFRKGAESASTDITIPMADTLKNKDYYDMKCRIINCEFEHDKIVNTDKFVLWKELPKRTYNSRRNNHDSIVSRIPETAEAISSGGYNFPQIGNYSYTTFTFSNGANIATEKREWIRNVTSLKSTQVTHSNIRWYNGGWRVEFYRKLPDETLQRARFYFDPFDLGIDYAGFGYWKFFDNGLYAVLMWGYQKQSDSTIYEVKYPLPWITVDSIPNYAINPRICEANGVLTSIDDEPLNISSSLPYYDASITNIGPRYKFSTMPSTADLLTLPVDTVFETEGFYTNKDGHGGRYMLRSSKWTANGGLQISENRWLVTCTGEEGRSGNYIDVCKYGIREYPNYDSIQMENLTPEECYADINSEIMSRINIPNYCAYLQFPKGRFFFKDPINLSEFQNGIRGFGMPNGLRAENYTGTRNSTGGTTLYFPFLTDGQYAIKTNFGNIEDISIYGNYYTYRFSIDRTKTITAPNEVVTEVIAEDEEHNPIKCTGIYKSSMGFIKNVHVMRFYNGIYCDTSNVYISNVFARECHFGLSVGNDTKIVGCYGWNVHTLLQIRGAITSAVQLRVDSCVNVVNIVNGSGITLMDVDGDYCTDSLITIGNEDTQWKTVSTATFIGLHGRCCTLKCYDTTQASSPDVRELADTSGYGLIRVLKNCVLRDSYIECNSIGAGNPFDESSDYRTPLILLTMDKVGSSTNAQRNQFVFNSADVSTADDIKKIIQTKSNASCKVDISTGTFFMDGTDVKTYTLAT